MSNIDWTERRLCDDGGCAGVIGSDGRCHVCGHASQFWGDERRRGMLDEDGAGDGADGGPGSAADGGGDAVDDRRLCPDGGCTGIIGIDRRCTVCGQRDGAAAPASSKPAADDDDDHGPPGRGDDLAVDPAPERRLCSDGSCTGLVGVDGRCHECGRRDEA